MKINDSIIINNQNNNVMEIKNASLGIDNSKVTLGVCNFEGGGSDYMNNEGDRSDCINNEGDRSDYMNNGCDNEEDFGSFSEASFGDFEQSKNNSTEVYSSLLFPQPLFDKENDLLEAVGTLIHNAFPTVRSSEPTSSSENTILNKISQDIFDRLIEPPFLKPYNWRCSFLKQDLLKTLGLTDDSKRTSERKNQFDIEMYMLKELGELTVSEEEKNILIAQTNEKMEHLKKYVFNEQKISMMNGEELDDTIRTLNDKIFEVEKHLFIWENERLKLEQDHSTFEDVVENLVGHTLRLRRERSIKMMSKDKDKVKLNLFKSANLR